MKTNPSKKAARKLGANRNELAKKTRKHDPNFAQSRDVREDRGQRQAQTARNRQTLPPRRVEDRRSKGGRRPRPYRAGAGVVSTTRTV